MNVKELIRYLQKFDMDRTVIVVDKTDRDNFEVYYQIEDVVEEDSEVNSRVIIEILE